jgi:lipid II isoglutaminyl synthase (glutamine-hydrolysing)
MKKTNYKLTIGWLYPDLMSTYGDRGNIIILEKRCNENGIAVEIMRIGIESNPQEIPGCDLLFMGGAQDLQQEIVNKDLLNKKGTYLKEAIENNIPGLFICGAYQFLGKYYKTADGNFVEGLSIFDLYTENPGVNVKRIIGNIIIKPRIFPGDKIYSVGFENHGGRTYLSNNVDPFADVVYGTGNNEENKTEGVIYKNSIGSYMHGPILSKNPKHCGSSDKKGYI